MAKIRYFAVLLFLGVGCARLSSCNSSGDWTILKIEERWNAEDPKEDLITFKGGKTWDNLGMKAEKIAEISGPGDSRVLAFRALSCVECEPDLLLTIRSTAGDKVVSEPFPGEVTTLDMESGVREVGPYGKIRAFFGKCLDGNSTEVFVIQYVALPKGKTVITVVTPTENGLESTRIEKLPAATESRLPGGCRPIKGVDRDVEG
jgi:hypothetical protein